MWAAALLLSGPSVYPLPQWFAASSQGQLCQRSSETPWEEGQSHRSGAAFKLRAWALLSAWPTFQLHAGPETPSVQSLTDRPDLSLTSLTAVDLPVDLDSWLLNLLAVTGLALLVQVVWGSPPSARPRWDFSVSYQANSCSAERAVQAGFCRCLQIYIMFSTAKEKDKVMNYRNWNNFFYSWKHSKIIQNFSLVYLATKL